MNAVEVDRVRSTNLEVAPGVYPSMEECRRAALEDAVLILDDGTT
ncbi:hypothetical protein [Rubrivirga sp.]